MKPLSLLIAAVNEVLVLAEATPVAEVIVITRDVPGRTKVLMFVQLDLVGGRRLSKRFVAWNDPVHIRDAIATICASLAQQLEN